MPVSKLKMTINDGIILFDYVNVISNSKNVIKNIHLFF